MAMKDERGNLDDVLPKEPFGSRVAHYAIFEIAFWLITVVLLLLLEAGLIGFLIAVAIAIAVGIAWRDIARRAKNPVQQPRNSGEP
jgi:hypothetical protein